MSDHGKPARQARDEFSVLAAFSRGISHHYGQIVKEAGEALDRIDTLTAERLWLKGELTVAELSRWRTLRQTILLLERAETAEAELRSLRQAVARWKRLRFLLGHLVDADNELIALVPSDNSWETEQTAAGDDPFDLNVCIREPFASVYLEAPPAPREEGKQQ